MAQTVSLWPYTSEARGRSKTSPLGSVVDIVALEHVFPFMYFPVSIVPPVLHTHVLFIHHQRYINLANDGVDTYNISPVCLQ